VLYRQRFTGLLTGGQASADNSNALKGASGLIRIGIATVPALIVGYLSAHIIKEYLFTPVTVSWALALGGVGILAAEKFVKGKRAHSLESLTMAQALGIGLFQVLALWPGTSRSAATIVGGMLLGLERKSAAEFSFLIAVPIMFAATGYELMKMRGVFAPEDFAQLAVGFFVSFVVALLAVKAFVSYLTRWSLVPFAYYRIILAVVFYISTQGVAF
jgi:undecaprenyl-diphosphatase